MVWGCSHERKRQAREVFSEHVAFVSMTKRTSSPAIRSRMIQIPGLDRMRLLQTSGTRVTPERTLGDGEISTGRIIMLLRKRERRMFARISTIQGSPERLEAGRQYFEEHVLPVIETLDGFQGAYFLIDRKIGKTVRISVWETEEALQASAKAVTQVRSEGAEVARDWRDPFPGSPVVEEFEVAVQR